MTRQDLLLLVKARQWCADGTARRLRERARLSAGEIAAVVDSTDPTVTRWESGQRRPRGEAGLRYAKLLEALADQTRDPAHSSTTEPAA